MKRIKRERKKDWRMPENAVSVTRPGQWGNPMKIVDEWILIQTELNGRYQMLCKGDIDLMLEIYRFMLALPATIDVELKMDETVWNWRMYYENADFSMLKDKDLACFCGLDKPCHANILIEKVQKLFPDG
ncbi:DUF4326 domain-containing protein [Runella sp.]|uniref:DUF4326 domain-containing protein n=1 Tax=Runella sp. TaxID=1960881 RepID=UPI003D0F73F3